MARTATETNEDGFRALPSVTVLLNDPVVRAPSTLSEDALAAVIREHLAVERSGIAAGARPAREEIIARVAATVAAAERPRLRPILNGTGVLIHTNLGRAPVSEETAAAMAAVAGGYVPLELDPETNQRGGRLAEIAGLMRLLTGAEATLVVNNNAAAILLVLAAVAGGRSVILSRGEAVEIGGGFRVPDVMRQSGARLIEVGTTNRTYAADYEAAIDAETGALLKVHPSNFRVTGFVHETTVAELAEVGQRRGVPVIHDQGSGTLVDPARFGLGPEPTVPASIADGATLTTASGDKLLGGPQAGLILGSAEWVGRVARHPLARAMRADKTCLAGLAVTLRHYARGEAELRIPVWQMIAAPLPALLARAVVIQGRLAAEGIESNVIETRATIGGGSLPGETLPSCGLAFLPTGDGASVDELARRLRVAEPGVFGRIEDDRLIVDLRSVLPEDDERLVGAVARGMTGTN